MVLRLFFWYWLKGLFDHVIPKIFKVACGVRTSRWIVESLAFGKGKSCFVYVDLVTDARSWMNDNWI